MEIYINKLILNIMPQTYNKDIAEGCQGVVIPAITVTPHLLAEPVVSDVRARCFNVDEDEHVVAGHHLLVVSHKHPLTQLRWRNGQYHNC